MSEPVRRPTACPLFLSRSRTGLKFFPYTFIAGVGLYTEDGYVLRGSEGQALSKNTIIPALTTPTPKVCCGNRG